MPPIIKKQIQKVQKIKSVSGFIKLIPLLFFVGFLIFGWLISLSAVKFFKLGDYSGSCVISKIPKVFAEDGSGGSCGDSSGADAGGGCDMGGDSGCSGADSSGAGSSGAGSSGASSSGSSGPGGCWQWP